MFQVLSQLLASSSSVELFVTGDSDNLTVTVIPKVTDAKEAALKTPLSLTGTPAELDEGFAQALATYVTARKSLADQVAQTAAILDAAKKQQAAKAVKTAPTAAQPVAVSIDDLSDEEGEGDAESDTSSAPTAPTSSAEPKAKAEADSAFDLASLLG